MAFVYRSSKNLEGPAKPNNDLNYYENYNLLTDIFKKYSKTNSTIGSKAAFGTKAIRKTLNFKDGRNSPGPGSYRLQKAFIKKSFNDNSTTPNDPQGLEGEPTQLFISKDKRFKESKASSQDSPGPCEYFKNIKSFGQNIHLQDLSHLKTFGNYKAFSPRRQISIPSSDIYYDLKENGDILVKRDKEKNKNIKKTLGPGSYDIKFYDRKNNFIDWSKTVKDPISEKKKLEDKKLKEKKIINDIRDLKINPEEYYNNSSLKFENSLNENSNNSTDFLSYNIDHIVDKICRTEIINENGKKKKEKYGLKTDDFPGPGQYNISFNIDAPVSFSNQHNFGSNVSRGLMFPIRRNKIRIGQKKTKEYFELTNKSKDNKNKNKSIDNSLENENNKLNLNLKNNSYLAHSLYVNELKEKNIKKKKFFLTRLGPGSYDPPLSLDKNKKDNYIQNFNTLEKRFLENKDKINIPGVGTYSTIDQWSPKKNYFQSMVPPNITQRHSNGISAVKVQETKDQLYYEKHKQPSIGDYYPEFRNSIEYNLYKNIFNYNDKKPSFNTAEKRFFEFKKKFEDENYIGKYNIGGKEKEYTQKIIPFSSSVEKGGLKNITKDNSIGPGAYRYDSYFDWNKKTYNMLFA